MKWSSDFAYLVGLMVTDGNLSKDGRHLDFTSKDLEQVINFKNILNLTNKIGNKSSGRPNQGPYYRVQFGDVKLYKFFVSIGLHPNKTKTLKSLVIPDRFFADFLRGHLDGDGYTYSYWDRRWKSSFLLYTVFSSASKEHLIWIQEKISKLFNVEGVLRFAGKSTYTLKYAKYNSIKLLERLYCKKDLVCLQRKRKKIDLALETIDKQARVAKLVYAQS